MAVNSVKILPTSPITKALVGGPLILWDLLWELGSKDPALLKAVQRYAAAMRESKRESENLTQEIERRLRAVESTSMDVQNSTGNIFPLSSTTPLPVSAVSSVGSELASAHGDHTHEGVHSIADIVGDVLVSGDVVVSGQGLIFPTHWDEITPTGAIDGANKTFTLPAVPRLWLQVVKNGQILFRGLGAAGQPLGYSWTPGDAFFVTTLAPKAAVGAQPADELRVWMIT